MYSPLNHSKLSYSLGGMMLLIALATLVPSKEVFAVPAFARQMNAECSSCHFQHFPKLNAFGRSFKASGYSMTSKETLDGENLSIPPQLNASFFMRSRYVDETGTTRGQWAIPDEAAILLGGRLAEGAGGMVEWGGPLLGAKISMTKEVAGMTAGATVFTTDALGAGFGFELMNTGVVKNQRPSERASKPLQGNNSNLEITGAATGIALHAAAPNWYVAATLFGPDSKVAGATELDAGMNLSNYLRAGYIADVGAMELGIGVAAYSGKTTATIVGDAAPTDFHTNATILDLQLQGMVGERNLGVYFLYAMGEENKNDGKTRLWAGADVGETPVGMGLDVEFDLAKNLGLLASFGSHNNGSAALSAKTTTGLGFYWRLAQNITLQPMYEIIGGEQGQVNGEDAHRGTITLEGAW